MASARPILWTLLLSFSLTLVQGQELTSVTPGYTLTEITPPAYADNNLETTHETEVISTSAPPPQPDDASGSTPFASFAAPIPATEDTTIKAPSTGRMTTEPFFLASTVDSSTESALATDGTASEIPTSPVNSTASVIPTSLGVVLASTVDTKPTSTPGDQVDPLKDASTNPTSAWPSTATETFASGTQASIDASTHDDLTVSATEGSATPSDRPDTNPTEKPAAEISANPLTSTLVMSVSSQRISVPEFATDTTTTATTTATTTPTTTTTITDGSTLTRLLKENPEQSKSYLIITVVVLATAVCACGIVCLCLIKRRARVKHFGSGIPGSQRSKKKKALQDDTWAGPVKLSGIGDREDCEGRGEEREPSEGEGEKEVDLVMSTFLAKETDGEREEPEGGVGRPGSMETKKWEAEGTPLLYIDEDAMETPEPLRKLYPDEEENDLHQTQDMTPFCLTTAV